MSKLTLNIEINIFEWDKWILEYLIKIKEYVVPICLKFKYDRTILTYLNSISELSTTGRLALTVEELGF